MVSMELAKKLRDVGLVWEPQEGDWFSCGYEEYGKHANKYVISGEHNLVPELGGKMWFFWGHLCSRDGGCLANETACECMNMDGVRPDPLYVYSVASAKEMLWLPSLSQLLTEIEGRGSEWTVSGPNPCVFMLDDDKDPFVADTPEDAAAQALLWILERDKDGQGQDC